MNALIRISLFGIKDLLSNKWTVLYGAFFLIITEALVRMSGDYARATISLLNVVLFLIPLISVIFGTMHFYQSREFFKLLLAQPVRRQAVYGGTFISLAVSMCLGFAVGTLLPLLLHGGWTTMTLITAGILVLVGWCLTFTFVGLSFLVAVLVNDRGKGVAIAIFLWMVLAVVYDGLIIFGANLFSEYPLERPLIALIMANPIDLGRILLLLRLDISALMGYTGAVFERFFGSSTGFIAAGSMLVLWSVLPVLIGLRVFQKRDL